MAIGTFKGLIRVINTIYENVFLYAKRVTDDGGQVVNLTAVSTFMDTLTSELLALLPSGTKAGKLYVEQPNDGTADFTAVRNSTATYVDNNGIIRTVIIDEPRIESGALLVEPQSTNLLKYSEDFSNLVWFQSGTTNTINQTIAPNGLLEGNKIISVSNSNTYQYLNLLAATTYAVSFWIKSIDLTYARARVYQTNSASFIKDFIYTSQLIIGEWVRINYNFTTTVGGDIQVSINREYPLGQSFYIWGAQLEVGLTATSYIPTTSATVTRLADVITVSPPVGTTSITETIDGVEQTPITVIPTTYTVPEGNINKIIME